MPQDTASLNTLLTMDNKPFENTLEKSTKKAKKSAEEMEGAFSKVGEHFSEQFKDFGKGLVAGVGIEGLKELVKGSVEFGAALGDASERLDLTTDSLQGLGFAFGQSGARQEDFEKGMLKLNVAVAKARDGDENLIDSFTKLGVSVRSLEHDDPEEILYEIADGMKNAKEPTEALAAAMEILGKTGIKLVPGLKEGSEALEELTFQGSKLSKDEIADLKKAGDAWEEFALTVKVYGAKAALYASQHADVITPFSLFSGPRDFKKGYKSEGAMFPGDTGYKEPGAKAISDDGFKHSARGRGFNEAENAKADEANKEAEEADKLAEASLMRQQKEWVALVKISEDIFHINEEAGRRGIYDSEMMVQLTQDRAKWEAEVARYSRDELNLHQMDRAMALKHVAELNSKIGNIQNTTAGEVAGRFLVNAGIPTADPVGQQVEAGQNGYAAFAGFRTAGGGHGLTTGGLTTGGLDTGGLNGDAHSLIRRGDAGRAKAAAGAQQDYDKQTVGLLGEIKGLLGTSASPIANGGNQ